MKRFKSLRSHRVSFKISQFLAEQVIEYLGRYTHKAAISNHRGCTFTTGKLGSLFTGHTPQHIYTLSCMAG
ncbi:transposase [Flavisolibacter nicotianae]|uniref:transposase n=1 Tax=Flavisolibacter nicotianae TaxID=2364882 RepID=UPI0019690FA3